MRTGWVSTDRSTSSIYIEKEVHNHAWAGIGQRRACVHSSRSDRRHVHCTAEARKGKKK